MPMLDRDGVKIHYEVTGDGPALILHPRLLLHRRDVGGPDRAARQALQGHHLGHARPRRSDYPDDQAAYSEAATVADMAALLDAVGAKDAVVGGLSLGGYMSLAFHAHASGAHPGPADHRHRPRLQERPGPRRLERQRHPPRRAATRARACADLAKASAEVRLARHRDATGLARAARGMLTQTRRPGDREPARRSPCPPWSSSAPTTRRSSPPPTTWPPRSPARRRWSSPTPATAPTSTSREAFNAALLGFLKDAGLPTA